MEILINNTKASRMLKLRLCGLDCHCISHIEMLWNLFNMISACMSGSVLKTVPIVVLCKFICASQLYIVLSWRADQCCFWSFVKNMNSMKLVNPLHFISWKNSFSDISRKCILPNMIGAVNSHQRWCSAFAFIFGVNWLWLTSPIIFGKMHFLLISENLFFHEIKCNEMTSFMEFMFLVIDKRN